MQTSLYPRTEAALRPRRLLADVGLALLIGFAAAAAKRYLGFHIGVPGHAGVGWIAILILGSVVDPRRGMTLIAGASMGLWGIPLGISHSLGYNVAQFTTGAAALESVRLALPVRRFYGATAAGVAANVAQYGYVLVAAWLSGVLRDFHVYGFLASLRNHVIFGFAGGVVAWALLCAWPKLAQRFHRPGAAPPPATPR